MVRKAIGIAFLLALALFRADAMAATNYEQQLLQAMADGICLEVKVYDLVKANKADYVQILQAAYKVLADNALQLQALGCTGAVAKAAVDAGADKDQVRKLTESELTPSGSAPSNLGGIGGDTVQAGGFGSPS